MSDCNPKEYKVVSLRDCPVPAEPMLIRNLKIEATGDFWKGLTKPKIRLMGNWLQRAGFKPGNHVCVICIATGVIELRSSDGLIDDGVNRQ